MPTNLITVTQAAEQSGLSVRTIRKACQVGTLKAELYGKTWLIDPADFTAWLANPDAHKRGRRYSDRTPKA